MKEINNTTCLNAQEVNPLTYLVANFDLASVTTLFISSKEQWIACHTFGEVSITKGNRQPILSASAEEAPLPQEQWSCGKPFHTDDTSATAFVSNRPDLLVRGAVVEGLKIRGRGEFKENDSTRTPIAFAR
jgi:hypothetical protein